MQKLLEWCARRGIRVEYIGLTEGCAFSFYWCHDKLIQLTTHVDAQTQLIHCLHECGHFLIERSGGIAQADGDMRLRTTKIANVAEEIEAWNRGRRLAQRLGIRIPRKEWETVRADGLASYMRWATRRPRRKRK